jgi:HK97 family phage prohead protease
MSTVEAPQTERLVVREFIAADLEVEGRMVDVRIVPFGEVARVSDPPDFSPYDEQWMPGVFDHQLNAPNRVHARYGHSPHVVDVVGHGTAIREEADGYHVTAKIHNTVQGETALELLRDGALPCVSLEARPMKSVRTAAGIVQRVKANLTGFAFCREGAFVGAQVLAVREKEQFVDEELLPVGLNPEVVERLRRQGIALPDRYQAHPAEDTSADADTPETAPASVDNDNTEES